MPQREPGWWNPESKQVTCVICLPAPTTALSEAETPDPSQQRWAALVRYLRKCVELEAAGEVHRIGDTKAWARIHIDDETLVAGTADELPVDQAIRKFESARAEEQSLFYGWPTIVLDQPDGRRLAPLFLVRLGPIDEASQIATAADEEPIVNSALLTDEFFESDVLSRVSQLIAGGLPFGDASHVRAYTKEILQALGFTTDAMDASPLSLNEPLVPGVSNAALVVIKDTDAYTRSLIDDLTELEFRTDWRDTSAAFLLGEEIPQPVKKPDTLAGPCGLSDAQEQAVEHVRRDYLTVITGPPGTGKTQMIVGAAANAWLDGDSFLLVSTNNTAVDNAVERLSRVDPMLVFRTGNETWRRKVVDHVDSVIQRLAQLSVEPPNRSSLDQSDKARRRVHQLLQEQREHEFSLEKTSRDANELASRAWPNAAPELRTSELQTLRRRARSASHARVFRAWRQARLAKKYGASDFLNELVLWCGAELATRKTISLLAQVSDELGPDVDGYVTRVGRRWEDVSADVVRTDAKNRLKSRIAMLQSIVATRRAGGSFKRSVTDALPAIRGWASTTLSMRSNFQLIPNLFDLLIVDEASQCSLAHVLPAAYRSKRIALVGDPSQLRPVVVTDAARMGSLATQAGLESGDLERRGQDHAGGSAYSAFAFLKPDDVIFLDEHYRCHPRIAAWFNESFYNSNLRVLTDVAKMESSWRGLIWEDVDGRTVLDRRGGVTNPHEAARCIEVLAEVATMGLSVGIVTPFTAQSRLIEALVEKSVEGGRMSRDQLAVANLRIGTAHKFQGDERDIVIFSSVVSPGIAAGAASWVEKERNLINVAVSRARRCLVALGHPTAAEEYGVNTLTSLRATALSGDDERPIASQLHSDAERLLFAGLERNGLYPQLKWIEEGYELDFAIRLSDGRKFDIEVDGSQHFDRRGKQRRQDLLRDQMLRALGWTVIRVPAWRCHRELERVVSEITAEVQKQQLL